MARPHCFGCRHYVRFKMVGGSACLHPAATKFSRINGSYPPFIVNSFSGVINEDHLAECDNNGWFEEPRRPWWRFWP